MKIYSLIYKRRSLNAISEDHIIASKTKISKKIKFCLVVICFDYYAPFCLFEERVKTKLIYI